MVKNRQIILLILFSASLNLGQTRKSLINGMENLNTVVKIINTICLHIWIYNMYIEHKGSVVEMGYN